MRNAAQDSHCLTMPLAASPGAAAAIVFLQIVQALTPAIYAVLTASVVDHVADVMRSGRINAIFPQLLAMFLMILFQFGGSTLLGLCYTQLKTKLRERFDVRILEKVSRLPYRLIEDRDAYELIHRIDQKYEERVTNGFRTYMRAFGSALQLASILSIILAAGAWWAALTLIVFSVPLVCVSMRGGKRNYDAYVEASVKEQRAAYLGEVLVGKDSAQERTLFGYAPWLQARWKEQYSASQRIGLRAQAKEIVLMKASSVMTVFVSVAVCGLLLPNMLRGDMSLGIFFGLTTAIFNFVTLVSWEIADTFNQLVQSSAYSKDLHRFFSLEEIAPSTGGERAVTGEITVKFDHVSFKYPNQDAYTLRDVNLELKPHRHYALVGINGAGKTTLIKLMAGLYTEFEGDITINGMSVRNRSADDLKNYYSIAYQDFAQYSISVREYFSLGCAGPLEDGEIFRVLRLLDLDGTIGRLPKGLDTQLGRIKRDGQQLSQGQWQRLMLARTLLCQAPIKIFDEPTSAIDPIGESRLYDQIGSITKGQLALFITHRLGAARSADEILVLDGGTIAERGTHDALMRNGGLYARMFDAQKEWYVHA